MYTAGSKQPCPWCRTPLQKMDHICDNIHETDLLPRPSMKNRIGENTNTKWQKKHTFNFLSLSTNFDEVTMATIVPPPLHFKLGIVNKIVDALDLIVVHLEKKFGLEQEESEFRSFLASSLSKIGARRERYYHGTLSGGPCSNLMNTMNTFTEHFFTTEIEEFGSIIQILPELQLLKTDLEDLSKIYNDSECKSIRGLGFYLHFTGEWNEAMILNWDSISKSFVECLRKAIWRPTKNSKVWNQSIFYKVPLRMPKLHALISHVTDFVRSTGYWALLGEEVFEHFQKVGNTISSSHSFNLSVGGQICRNLSYAWTKSLPLVSILQKEAEEQAASSGSRILKRKFSQE